MAATGQESHRLGRFLIVTWGRGGQVPPALSLARRLAARGHTVRVLPQRHLEERIKAAGATFRAYPSDLEWNSSRGRMAEDQPEYFTTIWCGFALAEALLAVIDSEPPDVLLVDCMVRSALSAAERTVLPTAVLLHTRFRHLAEAQDPARWGWDFDPVNEVRERLGLQAFRSEGTCAMWDPCSKGTIAGAVGISHGSQISSSLS